MSLSAMLCMLSLYETYTKREVCLQKGESLPQYVVHHPSSVWLIGPFFAALTGLAFKEVSPGTQSLLTTVNMWTVQLSSATCCTAMKAWSGTVQVEHA